MTRPEHAPIGRRHACASSAPAGISGMHPTASSGVLLASGLARSRRGIMQPRVWPPWQMDYPTTVSLFGPITDLGQLVGGARRVDRHAVINSAIDQALHSAGQVRGRSRARRRQPARPGECSSRAGPLPQCQIGDHHSPIVRGSLGPEAQVLSPLLSVAACTRAWELTGRSSPVRSHRTGPDPPSPTRGRAYARRSVESGTGPATCPPILPLLRAH